VLHVLSVQCAQVVTVWSHTEEERKGIKINESMVEIAKKEEEKKEKKEEVGNTSNYLMAPWRTPFPRISVFQQHLSQSLTHSIGHSSAWKITCRADALGKLSREDHLYRRTRDLGGPETRSERANKGDIRMLLIMRYSEPGPLNIVKYPYL